MADKKHNKADFFREKVGDGVDPHRLFAGLVGNLSDGTLVNGFMTEEQTKELQQLVRAYREVGIELFRKREERLAEI